MQQPRAAQCLRCNSWKRELLAGSRVLAGGTGAAGPAVACRVLLFLGWWLGSPRLSAGCVRQVVPCVKGGWGSGGLVVELVMVSIKGAPGRATGVQGMLVAVGFPRVILALTLFT